MRAEDVYELTGVSDPRLRPGGTDVAYVVWSIDKDENEYRQSIWIAKTDGSEPPRRFTTGKNDSQPRWSPDGSRLAFVSKRGDDEKAHRQLYVMPADGGEPACLTDLKDDAGEPVVVTGRNADRLLCAGPGRGLRRRRRQETCAATIQAASVQAGQRRLDGRPAPAHLRGRGRRLRRGEAAHGRRLRGRPADLDAGRNGCRIHLLARRRLGYRAEGRHLRRAGRGWRAGTADTRRRQLLRAGVLSRRIAARSQVVAGGIRLPTPWTDRRRRCDVGERPAPAHHVARPQLRPLSRLARADLGRGLDRLRPGGRRQRPRLPRVAGRR